MTEKRAIKNINDKILEFSKELFQKKKFTMEEIRKHIQVKYTYRDFEVNGHIVFEDEKDLRKNKYFKLFYKQMSKKYKKLTDIYTESLSYRSTNFVRGYRSREKYFDVDVLKFFYGYDKLNFDLMDYLEGKIELEGHYNSTVSTELYCCEFINNKELVKFFKSMVYENENLVEMSSSVIVGAIQSNNPEAIEALMDLLKAAKLSEGLRSSIINYIDYGSIETFKLFLGYIREEKLSRFSSVKNAFRLYTGLYLEDEKNQVNLCNYLLDCVLDGKAAEYLEDENPLKVYVGLYALAIEDKQQAVDHIKANFEAARAYRRICFMDFLRQCKETVYSDVISHALKTEEADELKANIISNKPEIAFRNDEEKREYILTVLEVLKSLKLSTRFHVFNGEVKGHYSPNIAYNDILQYVYELNDLYDEAYELFGKFGIQADIYYEGRFSQRERYVYLNEIHHPAQRKALIKDVFKNTSSARVLNKLEVEFTDEEYLELAKHFKSKRSEIRNSICQLFQSAEPAVILKSASYLLSEKKDELKNGGLSILVDNIEKIEGLSEFEEVKALVKEKEFSPEVEVLKATLIGEHEVLEEVEAIRMDSPTLTWDPSLVERISQYDFSLMKKLIKQFWEKFSAHKGEELEVEQYDGSKVTKIVGSDILTVSRAYYGFEKDEKRYQRYYFYEEFLDGLKGLPDDEIALLKFMTEMLEYYKDARDSIASRYSYEDKKRALGRYDFYSQNGVLPELKGICNQIFKTAEGDEPAHLKFQNFCQVLEMLNWYYREEEEKVFCESASYNEVLLNYFAFNIEFYKNNLEKLPACFDEGDGGLKAVFWNHDYVLSRLIFFDDEYAFDILKNLFNLYDGEYSPVEPHVYGYFLEKGLLNREFLVSKLLNPKFRSRYSNCILDIDRIINNAKRSKAATYKNDLVYFDLLKELLIEATEKMFEVELQRTDSETKYSSILTHLSNFYGLELFAKSLEKMKKIDFVRAYSYGGVGIKDVFSRIVASVKPEENLTDEEFAKVIKSYKISDKKLLEAILYNPHFTKFGAKYLKINGLEKALYYFKAHSLDYAFNVLDETKKMINRYSDFELEDFVDGKVDIKWFMEIQEEMDRADYEKVYDASKFIMGTAKRKRGQYFSDALLGKLDIKEVEEKVNDKRNQDMLLCLGLIPLGEGEEKEREALRRYKYLQGFLKESKQFGAQRRATEARRTNISISNLATNYGLDVNRFTWLMEAKLIEDVKEVFEPKVIDEIEVHLSLEDVRAPKLIVNKNGKILKSVPAKYKKEAHIVKINEVKKDIKNQYSRARLTLENAMTNSENFELEELELLNSHPIVKEIVKDVLFITDAFIGFLKGNTLTGYNGETKKLNKKSKIRIAHCVDLLENDWPTWQEYLMENGIVQPFKQVFRELYTLTEEEIANDGYTNRFAGYQIEGKKALGVLSSRNWILNNEEGFEKVNHAHNLRIDLYCYADWRNANDLEEETLEKVTFVNNKTNKTMDMKKLDKILFSETMRDLDLVVSVAYVGGVDPLLNHTTLEMRKRILAHNLGLFKISNYELLEKHIVIEGTLGKYSIHLGSGVVSVEGKGMLPMTPVHSQKRGHIFLPFVDEDPKTSEIITKALMLAEDNKLKDPTILQYLK